GVSMAEWWIGGERRTRRSDRREKSKAPGLKPGRDNGKGDGHEFRGAAAMPLQWVKARMWSALDYNFLVSSGGMMLKLVCFLFLFAAGAVMAADKSVYDFTLNSIDGQPAPLAAYKGKVVLLVNVASRCGFTPQYTALEAVYEKYKDRGLVIVGIPANNFGSQEPGTNQEIKTFCSSKYNVTFPMMAKISVKGSDQAPLYQFLTDKTAHPETGGDIQWNFTKFLVGADGRIVARFEPNVTPDSPQITSAIEAALGRVGH
ncbi:MAG: glutathione peroxidase, partial [Candidatus Acidiferrum sp.]